MELPNGKTCADCVHSERCIAMFGATEDKTNCGWFPRRFCHVPRGLGGGDVLTKGMDFDHTFGFESGTHEGVRTFRIEVRANTTREAVKLLKRGEEMMIAELPQELELNTRLMNSISYRLCCHPEHTLEPLGMLRKGLPLLTCAELAASKNIGRKSMAQIVAWCWANGVTLKCRCPQLVCRSA